MRRTVHAIPRCAAYRATLRAQRCQFPLSGSAHLSGMRRSNPDPQEAVPVVSQGRVVGPLVWWPETGNGHLLADAGARRS